MDITTKEYKGFEVIDIKDIPDCSAKGIYLRHKKTGIEVFHLLNEDTENLCAFCFRTPPDNSTGFAHILEHSVLCGSEKYPLKDPFIHLENQSLKTYLNALTGPIVTMYPVSSVVEEDYFNLMSVYGDSVFFPNLKLEVFMQEGYHLEKDDNGNYSIQGVVYNEMKGVYSSFQSVCNNVLDSAVMTGSVFDHDSGGNPSDIPDLTYEQYKAYHRKFYRPDNCLIFLCGNIPTEKQLDFLQNNLIERIEDRLSQYPVQQIKPVEIINSTTAPDFPELHRVEAYGPSVSEKDKDEDPTVIFTWKLPYDSSPENYYEANLVSDILLQNDGSPLTNALVDSGLIKDVSVFNGLNITGQYMFISIGGEGVEKKNIDKLYKLITKTISNLVKKGIKQDDIDCALMNFEISTKEVRRASGPFSLVLLRRVVRNWVQGKDPYSSLMIQTAFSPIKEKIKNDENYLSSLLTKYFLDNKQSSVTVITPSPKFAEQCRINEQKQIARLKSLINDEQLDKQTKLLREFQHRDESEILSCLPNIDARKIDYRIPQITPEFKLVETSNDQVPVLVNEEATNGITYINVAFPFDVLEPEDYNFISLFTYMITEVGWNRKSWDECATIVDKYSGSFSCSPIVGICAETEKAKEIKDKYSRYNITGRDWISFKLKMLSENTEQCLDFLSDCILTHDFKDNKRIKILFDEFLNDFEHSISSGGYVLMNNVASASFDRVKSVEELLTGVSNLFFIRSIKGEYKYIAKKLSEIADKIFSSGAIINLICDKKDKNESLAYIKNFITKTKLKCPVEKNPAITFDTINKLIPFPKETDSFRYFEKDIQVGFGASVFRCSSYATKEAAAEAVYSHWLGNTLLWEKIRTVCGAYGVFSYTDSVDQIFSIVTYRDPAPLKTDAFIEESLKEGSEKIFSEDEVVKAITGQFSSDLRPKTPKEKGNIGFERLLTCIHQDDVNKRIELTLKVTPEDIHRAAVRLYENYKKLVNKALLCPKSEVQTSKINKISL